MSSAGTGAAAAAATAAAMPKDRTDLLARAWTDAGELYAQQLVPRFDPWLQSALRELRQHRLPPGPVVVPCCGPGHELVLLHRLYGGKRAVNGLDLSQGMVDLARAAIRTHLLSSSPSLDEAGGGRQLGADSATPQATGPEAATQSPPPPQHQQQQQQQQVEEEEERGEVKEVDAGGQASAAAPLEAHVADASCLDGYGPAAAVLSVFGLQQMGPAAPQALASWVRCLAPGGVAVVVLWPSRADPTGPWAAFDQAVLERAAEVAGKPPPPPDAATAAAPAEWEARLTEAALRDVAGVELLVDRLEQHSVVWESAAHLWQVMTYGGPWRARRLAQGDAVMADIEARFLGKMEAALRGGGGGGSSGNNAAGSQQQPQALEQRPFARVIVIRRSGGGGCGSGGGGSGAEAGGGGGGGGPQPRVQRAPEAGAASPTSTGRSPKSAL
ncbi:hypothetical protein PLESTM_001835100 [Pleodorina starrii]|nr:hypothetical protein PLESTM_001835100 [Pleodorina starrii]